MWTIIIIIAILALGAYWWYSKSNKKDSCNCNGNQPVIPPSTGPDVREVDTTEVPTMQEARFNYSPILKPAVNVG